MFKFWMRKKDVSVAETYGCTEGCEDSRNAVTVKCPCMEIKINTHGNPVPRKNGDGDWYDVYTSEDVVLKKGDLKVISLGISIETPVGYTTYILPRSSTPKKHGVIMANSVGVIDHSYRGDNDIIGFIAFAIRDTRIPKGTRIAQLAVMPSPIDLEFTSVESLGNEDRGGFGSTGV